MAAPQADTKKKADTSKQAAPAGDLMDINTASAAQLQDTAWHRRRLFQEDRRRPPLQGQE